MNEWSSLKVMVTGGGGFVGSHVVEQLKAKGCTRLFVVRRKEFDLTKESDVKKLFELHSCDVLIHLAGHVGGLGINASHPADFFYKNIMMNSLMIEYAHRFGVKKVVTTGAGCGYPEFAPIPLKESDFWNGYPQDESAPYSLAKRMLHIQSLAYFRQHGLPILVLLPGNVYGPYDNFDLEAAHVVPALVRKFVEAVDDGKDVIDVWGNGQTTRDFVYAGDVAAGVLRAAEVCEEPILMNLSSGTETSIVDLVNMLTKITGYTGKFSWNTSKVSGQSRRYFDVTVAKEKLGFSADTSLYQGLEKTVNWYRTNRASARNTFLVEA